MGKMVRRGISLLLIVAVSVFLGFYIGCLVFQEPCPVDLDYCQEQMETARYNHEFYAERPSICNTTSGNVSHNLEWVETYDEMLKLIKWAKVRSN